MAYPLEVEGVVTAITYPGAHATTVMVDCLTPQGAYMLVFLGRRNIECIEVGTRLHLRGAPSMRDGYPTMYNPSYTVLAPSA